MFLQQNHYKILKYINLYNITGFKVCPILIILTTFQYDFDKLLHLILQKKLNISFFMFDAEAIPRYNHERTKCII
jgi:hypothetical protein